jgi:hypothetical protein
MDQSYTNWSITNLDPLTGPCNTLYAKFSSLLPIQGDFLGFQERNNIVFNIPTNIVSKFCNFKQVCFLFFMLIHLCVWCCTPYQFLYTYDVVLPELLFGFQFIWKQKAYLEINLFKSIWKSCFSNTVLKHHIDNKHS